MKSAVYCRVSSAAQTEGSSLESQEKACRKIAGKDADVFKDVCSGALHLVDRPEMERLRNLVRLGRYNKVVFYASDRLSRELHHRAVLKEEFDRHNVRMEFVTDPPDDSIHGQIMANAFDLAAKIERYKIIERTTRGRKTKALNGTMSYARPLFGYDVREGRRVVNEEQAELVKRLFADVQEGKSLRQIAHTLTSEGILTPQGSKTWWPNSIKSLVCNKAYAGETIVFQTTHKARYERGKRIVNGSARQPKENHVTLPPSTTPAIVSSAEWEAAQHALTNREKPKLRATSKDYLLRGFVRCGTCGRLFSPVGKRGHRYYVCTSTQSQTTHCRTKSFTAPFGESVVWHFIESFLVGRYSGEDETHEKQTDPRPGLQRQIDKTKTELTNLIQRSASMTDDAYKAFEEVIKATQTKLSNLEEKRDSLVPIHRHAVSPAKLRKEYAKHIGELTFAEKVQYMRDLDVQCTWDGATITCVLQGRWTYQFKNRTPEEIKQLIEDVESGKRDTERAFTPEEMKSLLKKGHI